MHFKERVCVRVCVSGEGVGGAEVVTLEDAPPAKVLDDDLLIDDAA